MTCAYLPEVPSHCRSLHTPCAHACMRMPLCMYICVCMRASSTNHMPGQRWVERYERSIHGSVCKHTYTYVRHMLSISWAGNQLSRRARPKSSTRSRHMFCSWGSHSSAAFCPLLLAFFFLRLISFLCFCGKVWRRSIAPPNVAAPISCMIVPQLSSPRQESPTAGGNPVAASQVRLCECFCPRRAYSI